MPHTYVSNDLHCIFATKDRAPVLSTDFRKRLFEYLVGISRKYDIYLVAAGGTDDHVHLLINLPATTTIAAAMKVVKGASSRWIHQVCPEAFDFVWQEGYGAFSVSRSHRQKVIKYINNQAEHHKRYSFEEEYKTLLLRHGYSLQPDEYLK